MDGDCIADADQLSPHGGAMSRPVAGPPMIAPNVPVRNRASGDARSPRSNKMC
jgi:hypothetical protein